jgi:cytidylate kinase
MGHIINVHKHNLLEVPMKLYGVQILLEKAQHEMLTRMAEGESQSLSEIVQEIIRRELRRRQRWQMILAARELQADYNTNPD